jgi:transposase
LIPLAVRSATLAGFVGITGQLPSEWVAGFDRNQRPISSECALNHWDGLQRFLEDGRIELDNNSVERAMRPVCLSRKNSLFAGSDEGGENWACLASLIETCKLNRVNPQAYFTDLLTRLVNGWPQKRIDELMPWNWAPQQTA